MSKFKWSQGFVFSLFVLLLCVATHASAVETWYTPDRFDGMDTWFGSVYNKGGMPTDYSLRVGGSSDEYRGLLRFNLSGLPQVATQAEIRLYTFPDTGTPTDITWSRVTSTWQEDTATWSNQPTSTSLTVTKAPAPNWSGWIRLDVTEAYNSWRRGDTISLNFGLGLAPRATNNAFTQFYSSDYTTNTDRRPVLHITSAVLESKIRLKWPLPGSPPATPLCKFGCDWGTGKNYCIGKKMTHAGVDITQPVGTVVTAMEDGFAREITDGRAPDPNNFMWALTTEHNHPSGVYTTVLWHIIPDQWIVNELNANPKRTPFIPKGMRVGVTAEISGTDHLHIGIRRAAYDSRYSQKGALPKSNDCAELPQWKEHFVDPLDTNEVIFDGATPPPQPAFTLTPAATTLSVVRGNSVTADLTLASQNGMTGNANIQLSCSGSCPAGLASSYTSGTKTLPADGSIPITAIFSPSNSAVVGTSNFQYAVTLAGVTKTATIAVTVTAPVVTTGTIVISVKPDAYVTQSATFCSVNNEQGVNITYGPVTLTGQTAGSKTLVCTFTPGVYMFDSITPSATQTLSGGGTINFTVKLKLAPVLPTPVLNSLTVNSSPNVNTAINISLFGTNFGSGSQGYVCTTSSTSSCTATNTSYFSSTQVRFTAVRSSVPTTLYLRVGNVAGVFSNALTMVVR